MKLTLEEAIALRDFLETICVSYYEVNLRSALKSTISYLNDLIEELTIYIDEDVIDETEAISLEFDDIQIDGETD